MEPLKITIPRDKWTTGRLRDSQGRCCTLGHIAVACGVPEQALTGGHALRDLDRDYWDKLPKELRPTVNPWRTLTDPEGEQCRPDIDDSPKAILVSHINDATYYSLAEKEIRLAEELARIGIEVEFQ